MGSTAEIIMVGGSDESAADRAVQRVHELEQRWSRFVETSEVAAVNRAAGAPVVVSDDTLLLVELGRDAWYRTDGRFDPTVLGAVETIGYTTSFDGVPAEPAPTPPPTGAADGCASITIDRATRTVRLPPGVRFDPGGIGKGLAADLVGHELQAADADGGCVNIGGDLRVWGDGPDGGRWRIGAADRTIEITDAGVATSGTGRRNWRFDGDVVHHLIDPATQRSAAHGPNAVTVVAGSAWKAETYATALMVTAPEVIDRDSRRWGVIAVVA